MSEQNPYPTWTEDGRTLLSLPQDSGSALFYGALERGLGSSRLPLDRGFPTPVLLIAWRRAGPHVLITSLSHQLGAGVELLGGRAAGGADPLRTAHERVSAESFTERVLAKAPVIGEDGHRPGALVVDATRLLLGDVFGFGERLSSLPWGGRPRARYELDGELSAVLDAEASSGLRAELTFRRGAPIAAAADTGAPRVAGGTSGHGAEAESWLQTEDVRLRLLAWLVPFEEGHDPLVHHPRSGGYAQRRLRSGATDRPELAVQPRFRLGRPLEYLVDPGIPEPYRGAVLEGTRWWAEPFAVHGIAFTARIAEPEEPLWGARRHAVLWVHRAGRGWSLGNAQTAPFTGEILRGTVRLGSERILQLRQLFETLLGPYGALDQEERLDRIEQALIARIRLLAAHEVGHSLGFAHNFTTHAHADPSVLDYPFPEIGLAEDGGLLLGENSYQPGLGGWDRLLLRHAYGEGPAASSPAFLTEGDAAHAATAAPWVVRRTEGRDDARASLAHVLELRSRALAGFGPASAPPDVQQGELRERFTRLFLLHRFHADEVAGLIGGIDYRYGTVADASGVSLDSTSRPVSADEQRHALEAVAGLLGETVIGVEDAALPFLLPAADRYAPAEAEAPSRLGRLFDPVGLSAVAAAVAIVPVLSPERLNRIWLQNLRAPELPGLEQVLGVLTRAAGGGTSSTGGAAAPVVLAAVVQALASDGLHHGALRELLGLLRYWPDRSLRGEARRAARIWDEDPATAARRFPLPAIPPGAPL